MRSPYSMDVMVEEYFADQHLNRYKLSQMNWAVDNDKMIRLCFVQFEQQADLHEACDSWEEFPDFAQTWVAFRTHFMEAMCKLDGQKRILASANIANAVAEIK